MTGRQETLLDGGACRVRIVQHGRYGWTSELRQLGKRVGECKHAHTSKAGAIQCAARLWPGVQLEER